MEPFRTILFAADFSRNSIRAFDIACSLATENRTRLAVLHVEPKGMPNEPAPGAQSTVEPELRRQGEARGEAQLKQMRELYVPGHPIDIDYRISEGDPAEEILRVANEIGADLIVMGTHGPTSLRRLLVGSVAITVLRGAACPVTALRSSDAPHVATKLRVIVHPTDFSDGSASALRTARSLARDHGARLVLLHVAPLHTFLEGGMAADLGVDDLKGTLESAREIIDGPDLKFPVETRFSRGAAAEEIVRVAGEIGCDLIVMGTHGRTGLDRLLMGNTAESVLTKASCPVLIVKKSQAVSPTTSKPVGRHTGGDDHSIPVC